MTIDKARVLAALRERLERDLAVIVEAQRRTQSGATHEESRPENDKDTRALESSYLARGQARRVLELGAALASISALQLRCFEGAPVAVTALIGVDDGERHLFYFMAPAGGGLEVDVDAVTIRVVTPESPLGRALLGQHAGSDVEVRTPQGAREYRIVSLS